MSDRHPDLGDPEAMVMHEHEMKRRQMEHDSDTMDVRLRVSKVHMKALREKAIQEKIGPHEMIARLIRTWYEHTTSTG